MVSTMLLGFSSPPESQATVDVRSGSATSVTPGEPASTLSPAQPVSQLQVDKPSSASRVASFTNGTYFNFVLGGISSRAWLQAPTSTPELTVADQAAKSPGGFHGVGFPDIRTYQRKKRSPFAAPGPWAPLVAWRTLKGDDDGVEPIARVRCMGLTPQAVARRADRYRDLIYTYADKYQVSPHLVKAVITEESCFNNQALSPVGAQGLMQLMPDTASWLKVKDSHDPAQNVRAGIRYLASLQKEFDTVELALAAYNAGPGNVRRYKGVPPFAETQAYVVKVQSHYRRYKAAYNLLNPVDEAAEQASLLMIGP